jgi:predicted outer membrane repeat protein
VTLHPFSTVDRNTATTVHGGGGIYYYGGTTLSGVKPGVNVKYNTHGNVVA